MTGHPEASEIELTARLTWAEICRRFPDQWVALVEMDWIDEEDEFQSARVAGHGPRRADALLQARRLRDRYTSIGHFFTGPIRAPVGGFFAM